jgi:hypothetical protein
MPRNASPILPDLVLLTPGTQVERKIPAGWSHLILKSIPRLASGDLNTLPGMASSTATMFHTVILADVRPVAAAADQRFVLRRIVSGGRRLQVRLGKAEGDATGCGVLAWSEKLKSFQSRLGAVCNSE